MAWWKKNSDAKPHCSTSMLENDQLRQDARVAIIGLHREDEQFHRLITVMMRSYLDGRAQRKKYVERIERFVSIVDTPTPEDAL